VNAFDRMAIISLDYLSSGIEERPNLVLLLKTVKGTKQEL
jgi:hypothetical protein